MRKSLVSMGEMARILGIGYRSMQRIKDDLPHVLVRNRRRYDPEEVIAALKKREKKNGN